MSAPKTPPARSVQPHEAAKVLGGPEDFPDYRLWKRTLNLIGTLAHKLRYPPAKVARAGQRAASRWFGNTRLSGARMLKRVFAATAASCAGEAELIVASDSSEIDKHGRGVPADAGPLRSPNARGYLLHQAVAVTPDGRCLGAIEATAWTRPWKLRKQDHGSREMSDKESSKWDRGIERSSRRLKEAGFAGPVTYVEDREGDIYEHLVNQRIKKRRLVVRHDVGRNRFVLAPSPDKKKRGKEGPKWIPLQQKLNAQPFRGSYEVEIDGRVRDRALGLTHERRTAEVSFRYCAATLKPPKRYHRPVSRDGLPVWLVEAKERNPPPGAEPLHWILICLHPVETDEQAQAAIRVYKLRWKVEDFTKITKSGCQLEAQHVDDLASFKRLLAVAMATANQLLDIVTASRETPARPAREVVGETTLRDVQDACKYHRVHWPRGRVNTRQLLLCVAQIGGYEKRRDRQPGWLVISRGWARIAEYKAIIEHFERHRGARQRRPRDD